MFESDQSRMTGYFMRVLVLSNLQQHREILSLRFVEKKERDYFALLDACTRI
jgi:hypothetical protein